MDQKWHYRFLELADRIATWSKDPSRGVGCVIVTQGKQIVSTGFNGLPRGIEDRPERLERPVKYDLICHAELNAIVQCARNGVSPIGCTLYSSFHPCISCAITIIQAGITEVVTYAIESGDERWLDSISKSRVVFEEAKITVTELPRKG